MNGVATVIVFIAAAALVALPRRWALLPVMIVTCGVPFHTGFDLGGVNFTAVRILIAFGLLRIAVRGESPAGSANGIDYAILAWAFWLLTSSFFHHDPWATFKFRSGLVFDALGIYTLMRGLCRSVADVVNVCKLIAIALAPLAVEMLYEKSTGNNLFAFLGGVEEFATIRDGHIRANGPFGHPILAGTVGGVSLPLMALLWKTRRRLLAVLGIAACLAIVFCSASSGPIMSGLAGLLALWLWRYRHQIRLIQLMAVAAYIALDIVMKDPAYFLIARIDLAGGSTSYYRARLIQSAFEHLSEWWLTGTDITRHWMRTVMADANHTDITNHFIAMGVRGGLPLMLLFIFVLIQGFAGVSQVLRREASPPSGSGFLLWAFGSSLFALASAGLSVSFFDQTFVFLYVVLGTIGSAWSIAVFVKAERQLGTLHLVPRAREKGGAVLDPSSRPQYHHRIIRGST